MKGVGLELDVAGWTGHWLEGDSKELEVGKVF